VDNSWKKLLISLNDRIDHSELSKAVKEDKWEGEFALSDDGFTDAEKKIGSLLTIDSAIANSEVIEKINQDSYPKHMKTALSKVEEKLKPIMDKAGIDYSDAQFISDKIEDLEQALEKSVSKGDNKDVIETYKKDIATLHKSLESKEKEAEETIKALKEEYRQKELYNTYVRKVNDYTWADTYSDPDLKDALLKKKWDKLTAKAHLKLSESGDIQLFQKDMPDKELYEGNKIATFQSLLEPEFEPYFKKSSPEKANNKIPAPIVDEVELTPNQRKMLEHRKRFQ
jgi:methionine salvage enolase-phosphatase E1